MYTALIYDRRDQNSEHPESILGEEFVTIENALEAVRRYFTTESFDYKDVRINRENTLRIVIELTPDAALSEHDSNGTA